MDQPRAQPLAAQPLIVQPAPKKSRLDPQQKKYLKWGLAILVLIIVVVIITVVMGKKCSNDLDCKFGYTCQHGWCKS